MPNPPTKNGGPGLVGSFFAHPYWTESERAQAEQDAVERRKYLTRESIRELERFQTRRPEPPPAFTPKAPMGAIDEGKLSQITASIDESGLHLNREKLVEHGKTKFAELLALGREIRKGIGSSIELTDFRQLNGWLQNLFPSPVARLTPHQELRGERFPEAARIRSLDDAWKVVPDPLVSELFIHWQAFKSLIFGQSLLDAADSENRVKSPFCRSGLSATLDTQIERLFESWAGFIVPPENETFVVVTLDDLLLSVIAWLADDPELAAALKQSDFMLELARELTGLRAPATEALKKAHKLTQAFALGLDAATSKERPALESWAYLQGAERDHTRVRHQLGIVASKFPRTRAWHAEAIGAAMQPVPANHGGRLTEFDEASYQGSISLAVNGAIHHARAASAIAVLDLLHGSESSRLTAVIGHRLVVETSAKGVVKTQVVGKIKEVVTAALKDAFSGLDAKLIVTLEETL